MEVYILFRKLIFPNPFVIIFFRSLLKTIQMYAQFDRKSLKLAKNKRKLVVCFKSLKLYRLTF